MREGGGREAPYTPILFLTAPLEPPPAPAPPLPLPPRPDFPREALH